MTSHGRDLEVIGRPAWLNRVFGTKSLRPLTFKGRVHLPKRTPVVPAGIRAARIRRFFLFLDFFESKVVPVSVVRFVCVIRVPVCARVSRVCPGSPRCLFTGSVPCSECETPRSRVFRVFEFLLFCRGFSK